MNKTFEKVLLFKSSAIKIVKITICQKPYVFGKHL